MQNIKFLIFCLLFFVFSSCEPINYKIDLSSYKTETLESLTNYQFPEGYYYTYNFSSLEDVIDPSAEIERLISENIIVNHAWYRVHRNGCGNGSWTTHTMYRSVFLICVPKENQNILNENYNNLTAYSPIPCGRDVLHFELK